MVKLINTEPMNNTDDTSYKLKMILKFNKFDKVIEKAKKTIEAMKLSADDDHKYGNYYSTSLLCK